MRGRTMRRHTRGRVVGAGVELGVGLGKSGGLILRQGRGAPSSSSTVTVALGWAVGPGVDGAWPEGVGSMGGCSDEIFRQA